MLLSTNSPLSAIEDYFQESDKYFLFKLVGFVAKLRLL
jgi:hypothetical protein